MINSKCQRMGVCNAAESLLVHADVAGEFLPAIGQALGDARRRNSRRRADVRAGAGGQAGHRRGLRDRVSWARSFRSRVVGSLDEAIEHINRYGSQHTDAIVTNDLAASREFAARVDSSAVMINASTRFNDGGEFGLGAEIGISTDKFHARGPCGVEELTSYKYVVQGEGQSTGVGCRGSEFRVRQIDVLNSDILTPDTLSATECTMSGEVLSQEKLKVCSARWTAATSDVVADAATQPRQAPREDHALRLQAARARRQGADAGAADDARRLRPQFRRGPLGPVADDRRGEAHQRRPAHLQRVRVQPRESDLLQSDQRRAARRAVDSRHQPVALLSDHRPAAGRRQRGGAADPPAAHRDRAAARVADHRPVPARR